jgi:hypothetical protein
MRNSKESEGEFSAFYPQTESKEGIFLELAAEHTQCRLQKVPQDGLVSLELQFGKNELVSYTDYRKTELTRKSTDWIDRASGALWLSTFGTLDVDKAAEDPYVTVQRAFCAFGFAEVHRTIWRYHSVGSIKQSIHNDAWSEWNRLEDYKHPLPENVYDVYMQYWSSMKFLIVS